MNGLIRKWKDKNLEKRKTMSVPEMRELLGLKKTESYWLVHRQFFKTITVGGKMRVDIESFERWYAGQVKHKKINGEPPGMELKERSYSFREAANLLGIYSYTLYDIWKKEHRNTITVDYTKRIPREEFDEWYDSQNRYKKDLQVPTIDDMKKEYVHYKEAASMLKMEESEFFSLLRTRSTQSQYEVRIYNDQKWVSKRCIQRQADVSERQAREIDGKCIFGANMFPDQRKYITRKEAANYAKVSVTTITKWAQKGEFSCVGVGSFLRIHREDFLNWLEKKREGD